MNKKQTLSTNPGLSTQQFELKSSGKKITRKRQASFESTRKKINDYVPSTQKKLEYCGNIVKDPNDDVKVYKYIRSRQATYDLNMKVSPKIVHQLNKSKQVTKVQQQKKLVNTTQRKQKKTCVLQQLKNKRQSDVSLSLDNISIDSSKNKHIKNKNKTVTQRNIQIRNQPKAHCKYDFENITTTQNNPEQQNQLLMNQIDVLNKQNSRLKKQLERKNIEKIIESQNRKKAQNSVKLLQSILKQKKQSATYLIQHIKNQMNEIFMQIQRCLRIQSKKQDIRNLNWLQVSETNLVQFDTNIKGFISCYLQPAFKLTCQKIRMITQALNTSKLQMQKLQIKNGIKLKEQYQIQSLKSQVKSLHDRLASQKNKTSKYLILYQQLKNQIAQIKKMGLCESERRSKSRNSVTKNKRRQSCQQETVSLVFSQYSQQQPQKLTPKKVYNFSKTKNNKF